MIAAVKFKSVYFTLVHYPFKQKVFPCLLILCVWLPSSILGHYDMREIIYKNGCCLLTDISWK